MASTAAAGQGAETPSRAHPLHLAFALAFAALLFLPQFAPDVVPINDTFYNFANFHVFYSEWLARGELVRWLPYGQHGLPADYEQLIALAPSNYLVGLVGSLAGATDVLFLFKIAVLLEQLAFVFGVWLLARRLFATPATALVLAIAAAGTTVWYAQQWWDLRIYYLLPLVLYWLVRWVETQRPEALWLAGTTSVLWCIGNLPYLIPLWTWLLIAFLAVLVREPRALARRLASPTAANAACFALFALCAGAHLWFFLHSMDGAVMRSPDRDPLTGRVQPEVFRTFGGNANLVILLNALGFGWPIHLPWAARTDNTAYVGLLPMIGLAIAVARERSRPFLALAVPAVLLAWLSFGGLGTRIAYHLPGMAYYRHVGLVFGLFKVFALLAAGFGLERLWRASPPRRPGPLFWLILVAIALELLFALPSLRVITPRQWVLDWGEHFYLRAFGLAVAALLCARGSWRSLGVAFAVVTALDVASYQYAVFDRVKRVQEPELLAATRAHPAPWRPERRDHPLAADAPGGLEPEAARTRAAFALSTRPDTREAYSYVHPFAGFDPCRSPFRTDAHLVAVDRLLSLERSAQLPIGAVLGCDVPKLRLAPQAQLVASDDEMERAVAAALRAGEIAPVVVMPAAGAPPPPAGAPALEAGRAHVTRFSLGEIVASVDVAAPQGAWLLYADAWHPRWRAQIDGADAPVHVANVAFKAVRVPAGSSEVRLFFDASPMGAAIAAIGVAAALAWLGWVGLVLAGRVRP